MPTADNKTVVTLSLNGQKIELMGSWDIKNGDIPDMKDMGWSEVISLQNDLGKRNED